MARIRIEDLPTVTDLNAEELEEIFGAGKFSFKPTFENLGAREMMDAGLGGAFMTNFATLPNTGAGLAEQVRVVDSATTFETIDLRATPKAETPPVMLESKVAAPGAAVTQADVNKVADEAFKFLKDTIIGKSQLSNSWALYKDGRESLIKTEVVGDEIRLTFSVYYRNERNPAKVQLNFTGKFEGGVKTYTLTSAGLSDYTYSILSPFGFTEAFDRSAKGDFQKHYRNGIRIEAYNPEANKFDFGKEGDRLKDQLADYIKARIGGELKSFTADVERTSDGFILKGSFATKEVHPGPTHETNPNIRVWATGSFEFRMKFVGFADGKGLYVCVDTKDRVRLHERDGIKSRPWTEGNINQWGMNGHHFDSAKPTAQMISPAQVANQVFSDAQRVLTGQGYTGFKFEGQEDMAAGFRVKFQAQAADGNWHSFALDVKTEGLRNYRTIRATNQFNTLTTTNDQYNPVLSALVRDVHGSWMWKQDAQEVGAQVVKDFVRIIGTHEGLIANRTFTDIDGGVRVTLDLQYEAWRGEKPTRITLDIKYNGEMGAGFSCVAVNLSSLVGYKSLTAADVEKFTQGLLSEVGKGK